jgi:hypothetical protein
VHSVSGMNNDKLRPLLWLGLIVGGGANAAVSSAGGNPFLGSSFGAVALVCAVTLIVHHYRAKAN